MENSNIPLTVAFPLTVWYDDVHGLVNFEYCNTTTRRRANSIGAKVENGSLLITKGIIDEEMKQIEQHLMELN
jgi:hypothetical protein